MQPDEPHREPTPPDDPGPDLMAGAEVATALDGELLAAVLPGALDTLRRRATGEAAPIRLPEWPTLARAIGGGLWPGLHIVAGSTGASKSQFALQLALQAARAGVPSRFAALELDALGLAARLLCLAAGPSVPIWWSKLYTGNWGDPDGTGDLDKLVAMHGPELARLPMHLNTEHGPHGWSYENIGPAVADIRAAYPEAAGKPVLLVIDFLQLLASPVDAREDLRERIGRAAYQARNAAREHGAVVLALSSTARANYGTVGGLALGPDGRPTIAHNDPKLLGAGKESGDLEFAVDTQLVLTTAPGTLGPAGVTGADPGAVWVAIPKLRAGQGGWVRLTMGNGHFAEGAATGPPGELAGERRTGGSPDPHPLRHRKQAAKVHADLAQAQADLANAEANCDDLARRIAAEPDPEAREAIADKFKGAKRRVKTLRERIGALEPLAQSDGSPRYDVRSRAAGGSNDRDDL